MQRAPGRSPALSGPGPFPRTALAGKGGVGKTTLAATMARLAARAGAEVVAIDADSNPNLALALGCPPAACSTAPAVPATAMVRRIGGVALAEPAAVVVESHALVAPDGVRLLQMGGPAHALEGCLCSAHATVGALLQALGAESRGFTVVDMEASPEHLSRGTARDCDVLLLITEPYYRSLEAVRRQAALAAELPITTVAVVANKVRDADDRQLIEEFCHRHDLSFLAAIPFGEEAANGDRAGRPLIEVAPRAAVVQAAAALLDSLIGLYREAGPGKVP